MSPHVMLALRGCPIKDVSEKLGCGVTTLKKYCRKVGIEHWGRFSNGTMGQKKTKKKTKKQGPPASKLSDADAVDMFVRWFSEQRKAESARNE